MPSVHLSFAKRKQSSNFQVEKAYAALHAGKPLFEVLGFDLEQITRMRQEALSLAKEGHFQRALHKAQMLQTLGDNSPFTATLIGLCLEGTGAGEEAEAAKASVLATTEEGSEEHRFLQAILTGASS